MAGVLRATDIQQLREPNALQAVGQRWYYRRYDVADRRDRLSRAADER